MTSFFANKIISLAVPRPVDGLFTYLLPEEFAARIKIGSWVHVPFGRTVTHAFVVEEPKSIQELSSNIKVEKLKEVLSVGSDEPIFTPDVLELCHWAHEYYQVPLGEVLHCAAPPASLGLRSQSKTVKARDWNLPEGRALAASKVQLNEDQRLAVEKFWAMEKKFPQVMLLDGITGSGKTEVYLEIAREVLRRGQGVLLLVPEIALTTQLHQRIEAGLGAPVALWHSAVSSAKRRDLSGALRSREVRAVVGARSAVFAPIPELGLIVVDEEHDTSYKQEDRVRYQARDLAVVRSKISRAPIILGSATPSLETLERVREGKYHVAQLAYRANKAILPEISLVDLAEQDRVPEIQAHFALSVLEDIKQTIARGDQVMVYLNRRGFAAFLLCQDCKAVKECPECSITLTVHKRRLQLVCHICDHHEPIPQICDKCDGRNLLALGAGTESLEDELPRLIPEAKAIRLDRDQITSTSRLEKALEEFRLRRANLLLGTQMLVKGHDFPGVTLVVVVLADSLFRWPDFRSPERAYQILKQVSGRAGRGEKRGRVLVQTFSPEHPVLQTLIGTLNEKDFLENERSLRADLQYPPFGRLARIRVEDSVSAQAQMHGQELVTWLRRTVRELRPQSDLEILGPTEAFMERVKGIYRWDIVLKSKSVAEMQFGLKNARGRIAFEKWNCQIDVDPSTLV